MNSPAAKSLLLTLLAVLIAFSGSAAQSDTTGQKPAVKDLNTPREFPKINSRQEWQRRATNIKEQVLVSCGLWPLPEKTPLEAKVFGKVERDGYSVEKVYFQSYPGFYMGGNLYRPLGKGKGPFPAILNPHGHWAEGRLVDKSDGSVPARCINFAKRGMIAFSYDMVGYNDTFFAEHADQGTYIRHRTFATNEVNLLWNISLMGLQTWNSIRALDFLETLPDVDKHRLACTGASGGGTQTFMLGAADDRLAVQAPIVMVSHIMQGGCLCENAPGLRVDYSNMEIAAAAVPRPQILVAATGDWTKQTLTIEGPAIAGIYNLFKAPEKFHYVRYDFDHNYNKTTREAVYGWFNKWLLHEDSFEPSPEIPYTKEPDSALRVFPDNKLPSGGVTEAELTAYLKQEHSRKFQSLQPASRSTLNAYKKAMLPAWKHTLELNDYPASNVKSETANESNDYRVFPAADEESAVRVSVLTPSSKTVSRAVIVASEQPADSPTVASVAEALQRKGLTVLLVREFSGKTPGDQFSNFYSVYNRTKVQSRVRDLVSLCSFARQTLKAKQVTLCGAGTAGPWCLLAAPAADGVAADCNAVDSSSDKALLEPNLFAPGLRNIGTFEGPAILAAPHPLYLHNTGNGFSTQFVQAVYDKVGGKKALTMQHGAAAPAELADRIAQFP